jgi:hypothetical protein
MALILSIAWWPLFLILLSYLVFLFRNVVVRIKTEDFEADFFEKWGIVFLLLFKSMAMTAGKLRGSFRHGVLCL